MYFASNLSPKHKVALNWFLHNAGKTVRWPGNLPDGTLLATKAKGIYKPHWSKYALSIRQNLRSPYKDKNLLSVIGKTWKYKYCPEIINGKAFQDNYTNKALLNNISDRVPIGVLIQVRLRPTSLYEVLGLGLVKSFHGDFFLIEGVD